VCVLSTRALVLIVVVLLALASKTAFSQGLTIIQGYLGPNLYFKVEAPIDTSLNDTVTVKLTLRVYNSNVSATRITVWIYSCGVDEQYILFRNQQLLANTEHTFNFTVKPTEEGFLKLALEAEYYYYAWNNIQYEYSYISLIVTAVRSLTYPELYNNYTRLQSEYSSLLREHSNLENEYTKLIEEHKRLLNLYENLTRAYSDLSQNYSSLLSQISQLLGGKSSTESSRAQTQPQQPTLTTALITIGLLALLAVLMRPWRLLRVEKRSWWFTQ
jgi:hypothetical protein